LAAEPESGASPALVYNLSERGLLLETRAQLRRGDLLVVDLPEAGATPAQVIWARQGFAGCEFERPLSSAAVSAALLRSDPKPQRSEVVEPARQLHEWTEPLLTDESTWLKVVMMTALVMGLFAAGLFIIALLSFPFSTS
jgi:hypothetical protein